MICIDTSLKGWQKQLDAAMKRKDRFTIITSNKTLAKALENGKFNVGIIKLILYGSGAAGAGAAGTAAAVAATEAVGVGGAATSVGPAVAGVSYCARVAAGTGMAALGDPEPVTKIVLAIVAFIAFALGCYFIYRLVNMLVQKKYKFKVSHYDSLGNKWELEGEPA